MLNKSKSDRFTNSFWQQLFHLSTIAHSLAVRAALAAPSPSTETDAARIIEATGVKAGFIVYLGAGGAQLTAALRRDSSYQVQGLERDAAKVPADREWLLAEQLHRPITRWMSGTRDSCLTSTICST